MADKDDLKSTFLERGFSVHTLVNDSFTREDVLRRIALFLLDARGGDVRAVVFTGHAYETDDGSVLLIPPQCSSMGDAIPEADWEESIRTHAKPGVIVFSILAHCYGNFMTQELDLSQTRSPSIQICDDSTETGPIFITFSASSKSMPAYESKLDMESSRVTDHFLSALLVTIRRPEVNDWPTFFKTFRHYFDMARANASRLCLDKSNEELWRPKHPQEPWFTASKVVVSGTASLLWAQLMKHPFTNCGLEMLCVARVDFHTQHIEARMP
ncbi:ICE-like protease (caspase) p20 domain protein [Ceratobasidium sp. AG-Ba]|nr:ICE-like protease (caspase) p20 domain protein [Ceratobasidium sp. AG-Ba]